MERTQEPKYARVLMKNLLPGVEPDLHKTVRMAGSCIECTTTCSCGICTPAS